MSYEKQGLLNTPGSEFSRQGLKSISILADLENLGFLSHYPHPPAPHYPADNSQLTLVLSHFELAI